MYTELRRYKEKEFCKDIKCNQLLNDECICDNCKLTAKDFHHWLNNNGFYLLKPTGK